LSLFLVIILKIRFKSIEDEPWKTKRGVC